MNALKRLALLSLVVGAFAGSYLHAKTYERPFHSQAHWITPNYPPRAYSRPYYGPDYYDSGYYEYSGRPGPALGFLLGGLIGLGIAGAIAH